MIDARLVAFELGRLEGAERETVEEHLMGCRDCLAELFTVKRAFAAAAANEERPSLALRSRLRRAFELRLPQSRRARLAAVAGIVAAAAASVAVAQWLTMKAPSEGHGRPIDSSSPTPVNLYTL